MTVVRQLASKGESEPIGRVLSDRSPNQWATSELAGVVALIGYRGARPHPMMRREVAAYHTWLREQLAQRQGQS